MSVLYHTAYLNTSATNSTKVAKTLLNPNVLRDTSHYESVNVAKLSIVWYDSGPWWIGLWDPSKYAGQVLNNGDHVGTLRFYSNSNIDTQRRGWIRDIATGNMPTQSSEGSKTILFHVTRRYKDWSNYNHYTSTGVLEFHLGTYSNEQHVYVYYFGQPIYYDQLQTNPIVLPKIQRALDTADNTITQNTTLMTSATNPAMLRKTLCASGILWAGWVDNTSNLTCPTYSNNNNHYKFFTWGSWGYINFYITSTTSTTVTVDGVTGHLIATLKEGYRPKGRPQFYEVGATAGSGQWYPQTIAICTDGRILAPRLATSNDEIWGEVVFYFGDFTTRTAITPMVLNQSSTSTTPVSKNVVTSAMSSGFTSMSNKWNMPNVWCKTEWGQMLMFRGEGAFSSGTNYTDNSSSTNMPIRQERGAGNMYISACINNTSDYYPRVVWWIRNSSAQNNYIYFDKFTTGPITSSNTLYGNIILP